VQRTTHTYPAGAVEMGGTPAKGDQVMIGNHGQRGHSLQKVHKVSARHRVTLPSLRPLAM
jgi:hypothetical protein